jgi:hypothetical protein
MILVVRWDEKERKGKERKGKRRVERDREISAGFCGRG